MTKARRKAYRWRHPAIGRPGSIGRAMPALLDATCADKTGRPRGGRCPERPDMSSDADRNEGLGRLLARTFDVMTVNGISEG